MSRLDWKLGLTATPCGPRTRLRSPIQLRTPPIPDPNRVFASLADFPEEMTDVPSVAQLNLPSLIITPPYK